MKSLSEFPQADRSYVQPYIWLPEKYVIIAGKKILVSKLYYERLMSNFEEAIKEEKKIVRLHDNEITLAYI